MPSRAVLVPALLGYIIQVALTPGVLGSDGKSFGSSSPSLGPILQKMPSTYPELVNLTLRARLNEITASWSLISPESFGYVTFRVTTAGVDQRVSQNSYTITGLACNTSYDVKVSPVDDYGADYGVSTNATIITYGDPELVKLTLQETLNGITAKWSINDPKCFPNVRFHVQVAGVVGQFVSQNSFNISGVVCNTTYNFRVAIVDAAGDIYGIAKYASITAKGEPELVKLTLQETLNGITATWSINDPKCFPNVRFYVLVEGVVGQYLSQNSFNLIGVACNTTYNFRVAFIDAAGDIYGIAKYASITAKGVPSMGHLALQATLHEITARWSLQEPKCFPIARFRVTAGAVDTIVSQNSYNFSGLACNTIYYVRVSLVDTSFNSYGVTRNVSIITKGVPELGNLTLQATLHEIAASWSLLDPKCFPNMRFRVTAAGVNTIVSKNFYNFSGLICNTSYFVKVAPIGALGYDGVSRNATIITKGVPEMGNLALKATLHEIAASWSLLDPKCFPNVRFRVTAAGVDTIVSKNFYNFSGLICNTSYLVKVSPVDALGASYGVTRNATIITKGVPAMGNLVLQATLHEIAANWSLQEPVCFPNVRFRVTTAGVDTIVSKNFYNFSGLICNTNYLVKVAPVDALGASYGVTRNASIITKGVPELVNVTLQATLHEITARWLLKDPKCFPDARFRVTTAGVHNITSQNPYTISGLACNTSYNVKVSPVNATGADYGVSTNATIITKGVPELVNLTLQESTDQITARWSLKDSKCFPTVRFRVTTAGVDTIVSQNSYNISRLACNTSYAIKVSPVDAAGALYGVSRNASIILKLEPQVVNLILKATFNGITASWSLKDSKCFPYVRFSVTIGEVEKIVSENFYTISGLACDNLYQVKVSPVNAAGAVNGISISSSIQTSGVQVSLIPRVAQSLVADWANEQGSCLGVNSYEVTLFQLNGVIIKKNVTRKNYLVFAGLNVSTAYLVAVKPLDSSGRGIGLSARAVQTTLDKTSVAGRCPYPTLVISAWTGTILCASVDKPTPSTNLQANQVCYDKHPPTPAVNYIAVLYLVGSGWMPYEYLRQYLRWYDYKEELLVNGYYKNGAWVWGFGANYPGTYPIDPALLVGLPAGGDGPNDYKMLYADPAKDFRLSAAKEGRIFGGMICSFPIAA